MGNSSVLATLEEKGKKLCSANVLAPSVIDIEIIGNQKRSLLDTGDTECFMKPKLSQEFIFKIDKKNQRISCVSG